MWRGKKVISMFQKGTATSLELKKEEFIADWKVQVMVTSKNQEAIENEKEFNKLTFIANTYLPNITSEYAKNELLRLMWSKSWIRDFDSKKYIRQSVDEMRASANLELLNMNIEVPSPAMWENPDVFLDIYKQAMDTDAKAKAILEYTQYAYMKAEEERAMMWIQGQDVQGQWNAQASAMSMNNINLQSQQPAWNVQWL